MRRLGVGVIGVGYWGRNHVRVLSELRRADVVAVCDVDASRAREVAEMFRVPAYYTDSGDLLDNDDVEAVTICTWSTVLAEEARKALKAGKHVLVEKPMARNWREASELVEIAEREDLVLAVGFVERFNPGVNEVRKLINEGELGDVVILSAKRLSRWPRRHGDVGVLKDLAIHDIDLSRFLLGEEPRSVFASIGRLKRMDLDDHAFVVLGFPSGCTSFIEANWLTPRKKRELRVTGSEAIVTLDYLSQRVIIEREDGAYEPTVKWREPLKLELEHFVDSVLNGKTPIASGRDGLMALRICDLALASSRKGQVVSLAGEL